MPRLTYTVRTSPAWLFPDEVAALDATVKRTLEKVLNVSLNDAQWCQASLPIRHGGIGVRRLQDTALVGFLASAHGVVILVTQILSINGDGFTVPFVDVGLTEWASRHPNQNVVKLNIQKEWDEIQCKALVADIMANSSGAHLARIKAVTTPEAVAWLHALPSPQLGTYLDNDSLRIAVALRLGCDVCVPHKCICGVMVEADGHHALSCTRCAGRLPRHSALNDIIRRALVSANIPCVLEPPGLFRTDGKRPDGLTLIPWKRGQCLVWDATCVSTYAAAHLGNTIRAGGAAAETAAGAKHLKYSNLKASYSFLPFAVEAAGSWGTEALCFIRELGKRLKEKGHDARSGSFLVQRISLAIQRGNAAGLLGTFEPGTIRGGIFD